MMTGSDSGAVAGGLARHVPVLARRAVAWLGVRDGGVYVELEALALTRDIPASLHWLINPVVTRLSRSSVYTTLSQTRQAIGFKSAGNERAACGYPRLALRESGL